MKVKVQKCLDLYVCVETFGSVCTDIAYNLFEISGNDLQLNSLEADPVCLVIICCFQLCHTFFYACCELFTYDMTSAL